ncbi:MAG: diaminopimelate epimerase [Rhodothermales bacterium]
MTPRALVLEFTKMNGAGNDFIVIDNRFYHFNADELSDLARRYCPRRVGVGADGLLAFSAPDGPDAHYRMKYYNADGSLGTMCGNGARCLVRFARMAGFADETLVFESDAGVYHATAGPAMDDTVRLYVRPPERFKRAVRLASENARSAGTCHFIWTGTEHAVCFVDDVSYAPIERWGPAVRYDAALQPAGANVNFVQVDERGDESHPARITVRTHEKGVEAETLACGTGAMASAVVSRLQDLIDVERVEVHMPGGVLGVGFELDGDDISGLYLEGPAVAVFRGTLEV